MQESLQVLDQVRLNFNPESLFLLNITLAFIMFGVALGIKIDHFKQVVLYPKPVILGVISQFVVLPALTFVLVLLVNPTPSVALGMILVAACPGGNISNFMTSYARGNAALSVTLTAIADVSAIFMTPINFALWGSFYGKASTLLLPIEIDPFQMFKTILLLLGIPITIGMYVAHKLPKITEKIRKPIKILSIFIFFCYVLVALVVNIDHFMNYVHYVVLIVLIHNAIALLTGYSIGSLFKLSRMNRRTLSIETGIQNSGLALVLIFNPKLFNGLGGMAIIAAWWGIWHIISGLGLSYFWSRIRINDELESNFK